MTDRCAAVWTDELDHRTGPTADVRCALTNSHTGPHRNKRVGITWGAPNDWFGDAA